MADGLQLTIWQCKCSNYEHFHITPKSTRLSLSLSLHFTFPPSLSLSLSRSFVLIFVFVDYLTFRIIRHPLSLGSHRHHHSASEYWRTKKTMFRLWNHSKGCLEYVFSHNFFCPSLASTFHSSPISLSKCPPITTWEIMVTATRPPQWILPGSDLRHNSRQVAGWISADISLGHTFSSHKKSNQNKNWLRWHKFLLGCLNGLNMTVIRIHHWLLLFVCHQGPHPTPSPLPPPS